LKVKLTLMLYCLAVGQLFGQSSGPDSGQLLMKSGFESGVYLSPDLKDLHGYDIKGLGWDENPAWVASHRFHYIVGEDKLINEFMESAIEEGPGPDGKDSRILRLTNIKDDPDHGATSRNEFSFFMKKDQCQFGEGYVRYWMKLEKKLADVFPSQQESAWYMIMEWKEPNSHIRKNEEECHECCQARAGGTNNYRININIEKKAGSIDFFWLIRGEHPQPCRVEEWHYLNPLQKVPLGEWFLVEAYLKKHPTQGRIYFAINEQVILDTNIVHPAGFSGRTTHPENPLPLHFWSPFKNYHGMEWNKEGPINQWYDDFELWSGFPPGHMALKTNKINQQ